MGRLNAVQLLSVHLIPLGRQKCLSCYRCKATRRQVHHCGIWTLDPLVHACALLARYLLCAGSSFGGARLWPAAFSWLYVFSLFKTAASCLECPCVTQAAAFVLVLPLRCRQSEQVDSLLDAGPAIQSSPSVRQVQRHRPAGKQVAQLCCHQDFQALSNIQGESS